MERTRSAQSPPSDFIRQIVAADTASGRYGGRVVTRFPPEPNGYLHVGHAMGICLNFGIAEEFRGRCHLRYDDTNPEKENEEFVRSIERDIRWLGFDWGEHLCFASDYFERMYECAEVLIRKGLAYVDSQPTEAIREGRGTVTEPGVESPYRNRSPEESLDLFRRMRAGEFEDGAHVLRGKIDMTSPNMLMRDPVFYRIRHAHHYRQGDAWCIYPLYDYAHCLEDQFEDITHSICTLEFDNNRELYDWVLDNVGFAEPRPHQYEWAGLDLEGAVLSKRNIKPLVQARVVTGWDDPRLATIAAYRRRGVPPEALRLLAQLVGVSKTGARTEEAKLDFAIREVLNPLAPRVMAVLDPLKVVITNYPKGTSEEIDAAYFPHDVPREGSRALPFSGELWIERSDFEERPPKGFRRLVPGGEVRLRHAYVIRCDEVIKDAGGRVVELRCSYDPSTRSGTGAENRKVKGTIHWVSAPHALTAEVRLFGRLFLDTQHEAEVAEDGGVTAAPLNPGSLVVVRGVKVEPSIARDPADTRYQFERTGYFWRDPVDGAGDHLVFNRIVALKDTWAKRADVEVRATVTAEPVVATAKGADERPRPRAVDPVIAARSARYRDELGVAADHAETIAADPAFFEAALRTHANAPDVAAWIAVDLRGLLEGRALAELPFSGEAIGRLARLVQEGRTSRRAAKDVLARMVSEGGDPERLVETMGLAKVSDPAVLGGAVEAVLARWPEKVAEFRAGKSSLLGLFVGEVMKQTRGAADPEATKRLLAERLRS
ncbi:MAG: glutamine--tRNA ligase/YqeY domain fusion protein [Gemmatimonadetes bacterium]|nr:glutamine--tRNA ligase/YqeY domain fusion protein [Gemmatimonadota bacterium]